MKPKLSTSNIRSVSSLISAIKLLWTQHITHEYLRKLSDSMPTQLQKVMMPKDTQRIIKSKYYILMLGLWMFFYHVYHENAAHAFHSILFVDTDVSNSTRLN